MEHLILPILIPARLAVGAGSPTYGETTYAPSAGELEGILPEERLALLAYAGANRDLYASDLLGVPMFYGSHGTANRMGKAVVVLDAATLNWASVVAAVRRDIALARERHEAEQARVAGVERKATREVEEREARTLAWLAAPLVTRLSGCQVVVDIDDGVNLADERVAARLATPYAVEILHEARVPEALGNLSTLLNHLWYTTAERNALAADPRIVGAVAARDAVEVAERDAAVAYVVARLPQYARAAREGSDVRAKAREDLELRLLVALRDVGPHGQVETYGAETQELPTQGTYDVLDAVSRELDAWVVDGSILKYAARIRRCDVAPEGKPAWRTGVEVEVLTPFGGARIDLGAVLAEPLDLDDADD
jgi:hypothetical protein